jgi:predicted acylesterase/phospholipase RssA/CRP-like cAMP-binding protein
MADLVPSLSANGPFAGLPISYLERVAAEMELVHLKAGTLLLQQGVTDESLYVILSGRLAFRTLNGRHAARASELPAGQCVWDLSPLPGAPRFSDAYAVEDSQLARLSSDSLNRLLASYPDETKQVAQRLAESSRKAQVFAALRVSNLFGPAPDNVLSDLEAELEMVTLTGGEVLFRQGDAGDALYVVVSGRLNVAVEREIGEFVVAELGQGETVGEMALLGGDPRSATVYAIRDTRLAKLSRSGFERLLMRHPLETVPLFTRSVVSRLRGQNVGVPRQHRAMQTIAVIACSSDVDLTDFCTRLSRALNRLAPALHLSSQILGRHLGPEYASQMSPDGPDHARLVEWLANQEIEHRHVIYEADFADTPWTGLAVRQADHLLFVGSATGRPDLSEFEAKILLQYSDRKRPASLILLHADPGRVPAGTSRWRDLRRVEKHYHVRTYCDSDMSRLARTLAGRAVGLVLGGGFARGMAHIGVIRALRELEVPIDFVCGTSMGAIIAGQCAGDFTDERIVELTVKGSIEGMRRDYTLPLLSLFTGRRIAKVIRDVVDSVGVHEVDDTWLPFFCVSSNLSRAEMKVHHHGPIVKSILASTRFPGLFPPITWESDLLVDGGLINNVPVDVMRQSMNGGFVIASDVTPHLDFQTDLDFGFDVSGWRLLWQRLKGPSRERKAPGMADVLMRTVDFAGASHKKHARDLADLYLNIPLTHFRAGDFVRGPAIIETGYQFARERLMEWMESKGRPWQ